MMHVRNGARQGLSVHSLHHEEDEKEKHFLHVDVVLHIKIGQLVKETLNFFYQMWLKDPTKIKGK